MPQKKFDPREHGGVQAEEPFDPHAHGARPASFADDMAAYRQENGSIEAAPSRFVSAFREVKARAGDLLKGVNDFGAGVVSGGFSTALGASKLANWATRGRLGVPQETTLEDIGHQEPANDLQKAGMLAEQVGEFFVPAGPVAEGAKLIEGATAGIKGGRALNALRRGLNLAGRAGLEAAATGGVTKLQGGDAVTAAAIGAATPVVGKLAEPIVERLPGALVNNALRPLQKQFRFGKNPGKAIAAEGIVALSNSGLIDKVQKLRESIGSRIGGELSSYAGPGRIDVLQHLKSIDETILDAISHRNQPLIDELNNFRKTLTEKSALDANGKLVSTAKFKKTMYTPEQASALKRHIGEGTQWSGAPYEKPLNQAKTGVYRSLRNEIENFVPSVNPLNERYSNLTEALSSAKRKQGMSNLFRFSDLGIAGAGVGIGTLTGDEKKGVEGAALLKLLSTTPGATVGAQTVRWAPSFTKALRNFQLAQKEKR